MSQPPPPAPPAPPSAALPMSLPQPRDLGKTSRRDLWWVQPLLVFVGLGAFVVYSTWAALQGAHYYLHGEALGYETYRNYLSPFYSPVLFDAPGVHSGHAWFGAWPSWLNWLPPLLMTPAILILWAPGGFRFTCYYYRGAYYKAFWADPLSCTVGEPKFRGERYRGERKFPLVLQNVHRYFLYLALLFILILSYDAIVSYIFTDPATGNKGFGIGVGSLILTLNPIFLGAYTFGCHSLRHLIGGRKRAVGGGAPRKAYDCVSCLNRRHMTWAWISLFWVAFCDVYIRLCSMGVITDYRLI